MQTANIMSTSGVNTGFAKCFILFMAIVILLEGCVYLALSIWGVTLNKCSNQVVDLTNNPVEFAIDLIYFDNEDCGYPTITIPELDDQVVLEIDWSKSEIITDREYILMICYLVISALWIISSLMILGTLCGPVTRVVSGLCFWPWFLFVIAGSILDAVATGYHIHDIIHTTTAAEAFDYVGLTTTETVLKFFKAYDTYFVTPAVIMTCISSRVLLIWLLNIFGVSFCLSISHNLAKDNTALKREDNALNGHNTAIHPERRGEAPVRLVSPQQPQIQAQYIEQSPKHVQPTPLLIQVPPHTNQPMDRQAVQSPLGIYPPPSQTSPVHNDVNRQPSLVVANVTYRSTDAHPDRLDYPPTQPSDGSPVRVTSPQLSAASPLNNRYSTTEGFPTAPTQNPPNNRVSESLRNQLPWSYTSPPAAPKPTPPRKPHVQIYPDIPEPDYADQPDSKEETQQPYSRW